MIDYRSGGIDFDELFDPDVMGDGPAAAGYSANGIALKYAALAYGTKRANVGYAQAGVDVSNLWAAKGTAVYEAVAVPGFMNLFVAADGLQSATGSITVTLRRNGECDADTDSSSGADGHIDSQWFNPLRADAGDGYQVLFTVTFSDGAATVTNGAAAYTAISQARAVTLSKTVTTQAVQHATGTINIKVRRIADSAVLLDHNVNFTMEVGNSA